MVLSICAVCYTFGIATFWVDHAEAGPPFYFAAVIAVDGADVLIMMIGGRVTFHGHRRTLGRMRRVECIARSIGRSSLHALIFTRRVFPVFAAFHIVFVIIIKSRGGSYRDVVKVVDVVSSVVVAVGVAVVVSVVIAVVVVVVTRKVSSVKKRRLKIGGMTVSVVSGGGGGGGEGRGESRLGLICIMKNLRIVELSDDGDWDATVGVPKVVARHPRQRILQGREHV